jgi:hypothetical protein
MNSIHVVLHGGLGNQLFQLYKARLYSNLFESYRIIAHSEMLDKYKAKRNFELKIFLCDDPKNHILLMPIGIICRLRIPKIIYKILGAQLVFNFFSKCTIVDGYFQNYKNYKFHSKSNLRIIIKEWRSMLQANGKIQSCQNQEELIHIRLGDFYKNNLDSFNYAISQLACAKTGTHIITNNESIVKHAIAYLNRQNDIFLIKSGNLDSWEVLSIMTGYRNIRSNGSSLAFWAATLVGSNFFSSDINHQMIHNHIYS